jgi:hypothetical protein
MAKNLLSQMSNTEKARLSRWMAQAYNQEERNKPPKIFRRGKTNRDRNRGCISQNTSNKQVRADWQKETGRSKGPFPWHTCNGKRNRRQFTGKGGNTITIERK